MAITVGLIFKKTMFKGLSSPFVMELPPYRLPTFKGTLIHMWEKGKSFVIKAGTIIFSVVLLTWFLGNMPFGVEYASEGSVIGVLIAERVPDTVRIAAREAGIAAYEIQFPFNFNRVA